MSGFYLSYFKVRKATGSLNSFITNFVEFSTYLFIVYFPSVKHMKQTMDAASDVVFAAYKKYRGYALTHTTHV